jgi:hypothetical protein
MKTCRAVQFLFRCKPFVANILRLLFGKLLKLINTMVGKTMFYYFISKWFQGFYPLKKIWVASTDVAIVHSLIVKRSSVLDCRVCLFLANTKLAHSTMRLCSLSRLGPISLVTLFMR